MDIVLHDFSGHPFQAELSRRIAADGHDVRHVSARQYVSGKGHLDRIDGDPQSLSFHEIELHLPFEKYAPLRRLRWELAYGRAWVRYLRSAPADVVIMCNVPLIAMLSFVRYAKRAGVPWIFWHQDIYSSGLADELRRRLPARVASMVGQRLERLEAWCARHARHVVAIGAGFTAFYPRWGVPPDRVSVIPNWAPLDKIIPSARGNGRSGDFFDAQADLRMMYAGTLGRKHNPLLLLELLEATRAAGVGAHLTVVSEGEAADDLRAAAATNPRLPLRVVPFQPASDLSEVLGSADILVGLLEPDATTFSIPSKVLSYMAAGRPILGLMPADNPAAVDIEACGGYVDDPTPQGARRAARWLVELGGDHARQTEIGRRSRSIAEEKFDLDDIAARFVAVLEDTRASARA